MINIYQSTNLFDPNDIIISWNFEGEKKLRFEHKIRLDQSQQAVLKIKRMALVIYCKELFTGRKNNFQYYNNEVASSKLEAINILDVNIEQLKTYMDLHALAHRIKTKVIPHLETIRPGKKSKIVHYGERLDRLITYIDMILKINTIQSTKSAITATNYA
jgi:hypothetical protein